MKTLALITVFACLIIKAIAQSPVWAQCGGIGWSGSTTCVSGTTCTELNDYYSQCIPSATTPTTTVAPTIVPSPIPTTQPTTPPPTTPVPTTTPPPTTTSTGPTPTGSQIRSDQDPAFHLYLQNLDGQPVLGPEASSGYFAISGEISLTNPDGTTSYLNVDESASGTNKPLTLDATATTTDWGLEGDTIITTAPRQLNFLTCPATTSGYYTLYLQEGNDAISGCSMISLHLPCLC